MLDNFYRIYHVCISFSFKKNTLFKRASSVTQTLPRIACVQRPQSRNGIKKQESKTAGKDWMKSGTVSCFIPRLFKAGYVQRFDAKSPPDCFSQSLVTDVAAV